MISRLSEKPCKAKRKKDAKSLRQEAYHYTSCERLLWTASNWAGERAVVIWRWSPLNKPGKLQWSSPWRTHWGVLILLRPIWWHRSEHHPSPSTLAWLFSHIIWRWVGDSTGIDPDKSALPAGDSNWSPVGSMWCDSALWVMCVMLQWLSKVALWSTRASLRSGVVTTELQILAKCYLCRCHFGNDTERCSNVGFENPVWFSRKKQYRSICHTYRLFFYIFSHFIRKGNRRISFSMKIFSSQFSSVMQKKKQKVNRRAFYFKVLEVKE